MKKFLAIASIILFTQIAHSEPCSEMVYNGKFPVTKEPTTIICHKRYVIGYSKIRHAPLWVAEALTSENVKNANIKRIDAFRPDPAIPASSQANQHEFIATGYDKGHMLPYEDFADDEQAANESFFMTNMVPQKANNNRGIWRSLEGKVRKLATTKGTVFIITGPIFAKSPITLNAGTPVPQALYKVVISPSTKEVFTTIVPNEDGLPASTLPKYIVTIKDFNNQNPNVSLYQATLIDRKF